MAHKKGQGSSHNGRESESKRLGVKRADGQFVLAGNILVILHIGVVQRLARSRPAHGLYNVDALAQQVQPDGIGKHMVILQNRDAVLNRSLNFAVGMFGQHFLHVCNGSGAAFFLIDFFAQ